MPVIEHSMAFPWPAAVVWDYLIALEQVPHWETGVLEVQQGTPGPPTIGTTITARRVYAGRETVLRGSIVSLDPGRQATIELAGGPIRSTRAQYAVDPVDAGSSVVSYRGVVELDGPLRLFGPLLPMLGHREIERNLRRLQRRIAAGIPATADVPTPDG